MAYSILPGSANADALAMAVRFVRHILDGEAIGPQLTTSKLSQLSGVNNRILYAILSGVTLSAPKLAILARLAFAKNKSLVIRLDDEVVFKLNPTTDDRELIRRIYSETKRMVASRRAQRNMTQADFGKSIGVSGSYISQIETKGRGLSSNKPVSFEAIVKLLGSNPHKVSLGLGE